MWIRQSTDLISKVLSPAVKFWLRSQVEEVKQLKFKIYGQDAQILRGYIPTVYLESSQAVYQGLHLGDVQLQGNNIRINIGQVLRGKPLKLLEPIWVKGEVYLTSEDLQASVESDLLRSGLNDLWKMLQEKLSMNQSSADNNYQITWQQIKLNNNQFDIVGELTNSQNQVIPLEICAGLELFNSHTLLLTPKEIIGLSGVNADTLSELPIDLGSEVEIQTFEVTADGIFCAGEFVIRP